MSIYITLLTLISFKDGMPVTVQSFASFSCFSKSCSLHQAMKYKAEYKSYLDNSISFGSEVSLNTNFGVSQKSVMQVSTKRKPVMTWKKIFCWSGYFLRLLKLNFEWTLDLPEIKIVSRNAWHKCSWMFDTWQMHQFISEFIPWEEKISM